MRNMQNENSIPLPTRIIACAVFKSALDYLQLNTRYPDLRLTYLSSNLHMRPQELEERLTQEIDSAHKSNERVICLYVNCFPDIEEVCERYGVMKVPGHYCYEMLLGISRFTQLINEMAGTYFLERDLILNFKTFCLEPLELHDEEMRKLCFEHYHRLLYIRQPSDPNLVPKAGDLAQFLELSLEIRDADYSHLESKLVDLIQSD